jgi:hypothetical protein
MARLWEYDKSYAPSHGSKMRKEFPIVKYRREVNTTPEVLDERWVSTAIENRERDKHRQIRRREELNFQRQQLLRMLKRGKDYHRG